MVILVFMTPKPHRKKIHLTFLIKTKAWFIHKQHFGHTLWHLAPWLSFSSSFNHNETCDKPSVSQYERLAGLGAGDIENSILNTFEFWRAGYRSHPLSILMRLATDLHRTFIYIAVCTRSGSRNMESIILHPPSSDFLRPDY